MMIFWRQKVIMELVKRMPSQEIGKLQLMKLLFLLSKEENINKNGSFYNFLPYKYGPFSFLAYRDINTLQENKLLNIKGNRIKVNIEQFKNNKLKQIDIVPILTIIKKYGNMTNKELIEYVYTAYPWYASKNKNNKTNRIYKLPVAQKAIYTMGYEGLTIDGFLDNLLKEGIKTVIDVRSNPISHKYGFSKYSLETKCKDIGLNYYHLPQVGIDSKIRSTIFDKENLWDYYINKVIPCNKEYIDMIAKINKKEPSVLLCFEKEPEKCHRHLLAKIVSDKTLLPIKNL
jgi:uncharacterized protein (DUF488 family)